MYVLRLNSEPARPCKLGIIGRRHKSRIRRQVVGDVLDSLRVSLL